MKAVLLGATGASLDTLGDLTTRTAGHDQAPPIDSLTVVASTIGDAR